MSFSSRLMSSHLVSSHFISFRSEGWMEGRKGGKFGFVLLVGCVVGTCVYVYVYMGMIIWVFLNLGKSGWGFGRSLVEILFLNE